jgi:hypothetical protein
MGCESGLLKTRGSVKGGASLGRGVVGVWYEISSGLGGAKGIGRAVASRLLDDGMEVAVVVY